jgi:hypothetical protein
MRDNPNPTYTIVWTASAVALTRHGRPVAAAISIDDLRELEAAEDEADLAAARAALASAEPRVPHGDVMVEFGLT